MAALKLSAFFVHAIIDSTPQVSAKTLRTAAGDVVIFDKRLWHRGAAMVYGANGRANVAFTVGRRGARLLAQVALSLSLTVGCPPVCVYTY